MKKIFNEILKFIKDNIFFLLFLGVMFLVLTYRLPYSIYTPGGATNLEERLEGDVISAEGSLNLTYVRVLEGTIPTILLAKLIPEWNIIKNEDITYDGETIEIENLRSRINLYSSISSATYVAYNNANIDVNVVGSSHYVYYIYDTADTTLQVGDAIISYDGNTFDEIDSLTNYLETKNSGDEINFIVKRNNKETQAKATLYDDEGTPRIGIIVKNILDYDNTPSVTYKYDDAEYGPSGGLMMSLAFYNALVEDDITKGNKICGTGTIDYDGTVGEIGGVEYKISGAVKNNCSIFIVPENNYEEAYNIASERNYDIKLIKATSFSQVLQELNSL